MELLASREVIGRERSLAGLMSPGAPVVSRAALALSVFLVLLLAPRVVRGGEAAAAVTGAVAAVPPARAPARHHAARPLTAIEARSRVLAKVMFRVLAFDRQLERRCKYGAVRVVIVGGEGAGSRGEAKALARALEAARGTTIAGLPYEYQIADRVPRNESYEVIFLPAGLPRPVVREALDDARARGVLCLTTDLAYLRRGAAVAILVGDERPEIVIQRNRAIEQGAEFDPRLYAYSSVISD